MFNACADPPYKKDNLISVFLRQRWKKESKGPLKAFIMATNVFLCFYDLSYYLSILLIVAFQDTVLSIFAFQDTFLSGSSKCNSYDKGQLACKKNTKS